MILINKKEYKVNLDIKLGTQKLMGIIMKDPKNEKNPRYMEIVLKDILIPSPSTTDIFHFRMSDIEKIFNEFGEDANKTESDFKKKLSQ